MNQKLDAEWCCAGCGKPTPGRIRACDCPTSVLHKNAKEHTTKIDAPALVERLERHAPKTTGAGGDGLPLFMGMEPDNDGAWVRFVAVSSALEAREARIADLEAENGRLREGFSRLSKSDRALLESRRASARAARDGK